MDANERAFRAERILVASGLNLNGTKQATLDALSSHLIDLLHLINREEGFPAPIHRYHLSSIRLLTRAWDRFLVELQVAESQEPQP